MNKIAFISDVHGNYPALLAVLDDIDKKNVKNIICLGDLVGYYSMINEVIETIRNRDIHTILGNHDFALVYNNGRIERSKTCTHILENQLTYISSENLVFLSELPNQLITESNGKSFFCVHGGLNDPIDEYLFETNEAYFNSHNFKNDFLVTGHIHQFLHLKTNEITHINPGSVGQPRDNDPRASYLITDGFQIVQHRVEYNIDEIANDMIKMGFSEYIYAGLYTGKKIS